MEKGSSVRGLEAESEEEGSWVWDRGASFGFSPNGGAWRVLLADSVVFDWEDEEDSNVWDWLTGLRWRTPALAWRGISLLYT